MKSVIRDIHQQLVSGKITCRELVQEKISLLSDNAYNTANLLLEESAFALAAQVDEKINTGQPVGLLEGIPFGVEDIIMLQGSVATGSAGFLKNYTSPYTATAVSKLMEAGAIPVAKENGDSFGQGNTGENSVFGAVCNAHDKSRVAGGSCSGSAVNVAKGYTAFSVAGNTGGAVAAGYNKVYGLRPTYGRVSRYGMMANMSSTDCIGPIASSPEDIRMLINAMSGKDSHDQISCTSTPVPDTDFE
jgi:aspartyl-tRNA(Asn)/glutamyl-tRNA(Gln) amidotransferase subunit A